MIKEPQKECKGCYRPNRIINAHFTLCQWCNNKRLKQGAAKGGPSKRRTPTGEAQVFLRIWEERQHICINCQTHLGNEPRAHYFSHIKPKSTHSELRLNPDNIQLLCFDCHQAHDQQGQDAFNKRKRQK